MRHGEAESSASSDAARRLTPSGAQSVITRIQYNAERLSSVNRVIHSPYLRAIQTAESVAHGLNLTAMVDSSLWTPDADPLAALESLADHMDSTPLIVTHMPLISYVEALCCEGAIAYPRSFSCAEIAEIKVEWPAAGLGSLVRRF